MNSDNYRNTTLSSVTQCGHQYGDIHSETLAGQQDDEVTMFDNDVKRRELNENTASATQDAISRTNSTSAGDSGPLDPASDESGAEPPDHMIPLAPLVPPVPSSNKIPDGYVSCDDGIYAVSSTGEDDLTFVCSPLSVEARFSDRNSRGWGKLVAVKDGNGRWHRIPISNADLITKATEVLAGLLDHGLKIGVHTESKGLLKTLLAMWTPDQNLVSTSKQGWVGESFESFVCGEAIIGKKDVVAILASGNGPTRLLTAKGSVESWRDNIGMKCRGNPLMVLAVSLAFSGPLLAILGQSGGGLHFRGSSSSGKTTLLRLATSVWGSRHLIGQWRATSNGLEALACEFNDILLPLDEIAEISPKALHEAVYMLANGTAKRRMTKMIALEETAQWRLAIISSGEISIEEKLREGRLDAKIGQEVRLIDIEADIRAWGVFDDLHGCDTPAVFSEVIREGADLHHGAVGQKFVETLISRSHSGLAAKLTGMVRKKVTEWLAELPSAADGQIERVAYRFALIGLAGSLATVAKLTGWEKNTAMDAAKEVFLDWYDRRFGDEREALDPFIRPLQEFIAKNFLSLPESGLSTGGTSKPLGWRDASHVYLTHETWANIYPVPLGEKAARALLDMQILIPGDTGRTIRKVPRAVLKKRPRLYTVNIHKVTTYNPDQS